MDSNTQYAVENQERVRFGLIQDKFNKIGKKVNESVARFEKRNRVTTTTIILMLGVAISYYLIQFVLNLIPFIGWIFSSFIGIYSWLTFYTWTSIKGWGMSDSIKKFIVSKILPAIGCVGLFNFGPEITLGVVFTLLIVKSEDFIYNTTKGRMDKEVIKEGVAFFNLFRKI